MGLDTVELVMAFEEAFCVEIPNRAAEGMVSPRHVRDFVMEEYRRVGTTADAEEIFRKIREIACNFSSADPEKIGLDTTFVEDLRLD